ncbi:Tubulin-specific chaperone B [Phytophthora cinnamomi]|uniref:Tubulin-specific chaperone B n=1 Tax=Phytophthora cinnamomi TaxID=4785 RepID=UPI00355A387E|nr:Tubulin-specific chaperone B [Phytophthora cinnamomi]
MDGRQYENVPEGVVCLLITHSNLKLQMVDIRLDLHGTVGELRHKVYQHTGTARRRDARRRVGLRAAGRRPADAGLLQRGERHAAARRGQGPVLAVQGGGLEDVSSAQRSEKTVRAYKREQPPRNWKPKTMMNAARPATDAATVSGPESVASMKVGDRCEVQPGGRRGQVQYVGEIPEIALATGWACSSTNPWAKATAPSRTRPTSREQKFGGFVRPHNVVVGDFLC